MGEREKERENKERGGGGIRTRHTSREMRKLEAISVQNRTQSHLQSASLRNQMNCWALVPDSP